jgi:hypothetical protein
MQSGQQYQRRRFFSFCILVSTVLSRQRPHEYFKFHALLIAVNSGFAKAFTRRHYSVSPRVYATAFEYRDVAALQDYDRLLVYYFFSILIDIFDDLMVLIIYKDF